MHVLDGARDHVADELALVRLGDHARGDELSVAQDGHALGELEDLLEAMADVDDRDALAVQAPDQREELIGLAAREIARGLVEDQEAGAAHGGAGGRHELLLPDGQRTQGRAGRQVKADLVEDRLRPAHHGAVLQPAQGRGLLSQEHVGRDGEMGAEHHFLMHRVDAQRDGVVGRVEVDLPTLPEDASGGARVHARQELDQGRFAGPVLADDGVNLSGPEREVHALQGVGAGKALVELAQLEDRDVGREPLLLEAWRRNGPGAALGREPAHGQGPPESTSEPAAITSPSGSGAPGSAARSCWPW
jgi:hypothetical protein